MNLEEAFSKYNSYKNSTLSGRYLGLKNIYKQIEQLPNPFHTYEIGKSVNQLPIYVTKWGSGSKKILAWSLMHGNETTTTKSLFDLVRFLDVEKDSDNVKQLAQKIELAIIFVLNPDGTKAYTRVNANQVDLNRDAQDESQPEMKALRQFYSVFKPDLCLNLHGQRSIFSAGTRPNPAIISFLSPSVNKTRSITSARKQSMQLISSVASLLERYIPQQIGTYDDAYNPNCTGDFFQGLGTPCILFEAGHYPKDYQREETRRLIFLAYLKVLKEFAEDNYHSIPISNYHQIPKNQKLFCDLILRRVKIKNTDYDFVIQYEEQLQNINIQFVPKLIDLQEESSLYAHQEIVVDDVLTHINAVEVEHFPKLNIEINNIRTKTKHFSLKMVNK